MAILTLETATFWSGLPSLYEAVSGALRRALTDQGTPPVILCHISHVYPAGASLYYTVGCAALNDPLTQWRAAKAAAADAIIANGGSISHHHGVGRDHLPWYQQEVGELGIRAELKQTGTSHLEGTLDLSGGGELGNIIVGKLKLDASGSGTKSSDKTTETEPIGTTPADLSGVARILDASEKKLVIEDFHYVTEENRRSFAFLLKALGDYGVHVILVGVWPEDHLLTYYNGDLDGRVEDLYLEWSG